MRETSESICEEKKTVTDTRTNEERFGYQRENDIDTDAYLDREGSRALLLLLLSSLLAQSVRELFQRLRSRGDGR